LSHKDRLSLAITLGDPAGIGPEVVLRALADPHLLAAANFTLVGNHRLLKAQAQVLGLPLPPVPTMDVPSNADITLGQPSAASGDLSFRSLVTAIEATKAKKFAGIITAPIAKSFWAEAGHPYPGQTELLAQLTAVDHFAMMFVGRSPHTGWQLRAMLATTHIPLMAVSQQLSPPLLDRKLDLLIATLAQDFAINQPTIAIAGLNPHSGEQGQLGSEEVTWLQPWLHQAQQRYPQAQLQGLLPPDTMWVNAGQAWFGTGQPMVADAFLALYHDQGLIPVKLMAFDRAVNTTVGLPFVRTSPDHGTAFNIADRGQADATSMKEAIQLAIFLAQRRRDCP
jgi:4-hydroxythreonine-4-phosphate dehydrogenase